MTGRKTVTDFVPFKNHLSFINFLGKLLEAQKMVPQNKHTIGKKPEKRKNKRIKLCVITAFHKFPDLV